MVEIRAAFSVALASLLAGVQAAPALAQQTRPALEVAGQVSSIGANSTVLGESSAVAATATLVVNTSSLVDFEAQVTWSLRSREAVYGFQGGRTMMASAGLRATFIRAGRVECLRHGHGRRAPLVEGFDRILDRLDWNLDRRYRSGEPLSLTTGGGVAVRLSSRVSAVAEADLNLSSVSSSSLVLATFPHAELIETLPPQVGS